MLRKVLKTIFPRVLVDRLKLAYEWLDVRLAKIASVSSWLTMAYYLVWSSEFIREMRSVLIARKYYYQARSGKNPNSYLLRRNIHRLEKGLIMQPRRHLFGEGYIEETVNYFSLCLQENILTSSEQIWAHSVLTEYFSVVSSSSITDNARWNFSSILNDQLIQKSDIQFKPITHSALESSKVTFDDFKSLCSRRHSVRWFAPVPVPEECLKAAIDVAATAPSACNRQPLKFHIFNDPERAREIGGIPMGTAGFSHNFQCVVVLVGDLSAYPFEKDRHIIYIDGALAAMQFQLALETLGLSTCTINWPDVERHEIKMARALNLSPYQRPIMLIAVGYADDGTRVPYSSKKSSADIMVKGK